MIPNIILIAIAAACWALMSHYTFHNRVKDPYSFWGEESWKRKYKREGMNATTNDPYRLYAAPDTWYYRFFKINYRERFPLSATVLVFLTDGYHLVQWVGVKCLCIAIASDIKEFFILWAVWLIVFNIIYIKKKNPRGGPRV